MNWAAVLACMTVGIVSEEYIGVLTVLICSAVVFIVSLIIKRKIDLQILVCLLAVCIGAVSVSFKLREDNSLDTYSGHYVSVTGTVLTMPKKYDDNYKYTLEINSVTMADKTENIKKLITVTTPAMPNVNDTVILKGFIKHINGAYNEYGFDSKLYYKAKNIHYRMFSKTAELSEIKLPKYYPSVLSAKIKEAASNLISDVSSDDNRGILKAVITGNNDEISNGLSDALDKSGIGRFLYFSYFFIFVFSFLINEFTGKISRALRTYIFIGILFLIAVLNCDRPAFIKNCIYLAAVMIFALKFGYVHKPSMLCLGVIPMLAANPLIIYDGGFVISTSASVLNIIFGDYVRAKLKFIKIGIIRSSISSGLICLIGLLPLSAFYFNKISLYQILFVFAYIPINIIIWLSFFPAAWLVKSFGTAPILSQILSFALFFYRKIPYIAEKLPLAYIYLPTPGIITMTAAAMLLFAAYLKVYEKRSVLALTCACVLAIVSIGIKIPSLRNVEITFVNVGQGDGAVISLPYRTNVIIDGGGGNAFSEYNPGRELFVPYLISHGKTNIDAAFISHYHQDHVQGVIAAVEELNVKTLYMPNSLPDNEYRIEAENAAKENGTEIKYISEDTELFFGTLRLDIKAPDESVLSDGDENDTSLVINAEYGDVDCLFTGDMTKYSENNLLSKNKISQAEILKVAHHGSATSTGQEFVNKVNPKICVISLGEDNMYDFPRQSVLDALNGRTIYRTDESGDVTVTADKKHIKNVKTYK